MTRSVENFPPSVYFSAYLSLLMLLYPIFKLAEKYFSTETAIYLVFSTALVYFTTAIFTARLPLMTSTGNYRYRGVSAVVFSVMLLGLTALAGFYELDRSLIRFDSIAFLKFTPFGIAYALLLRHLASKALKNTPEEHLKVSGGNQRM